MESCTTTVSWPFRVKVPVVGCSEAVAQRFCLLDALVSYILCLVRLTVTACWLRSAQQW